MNWTPDLGVLINNEHNDNIFYDREQRISDTITTVAPSAELAGESSKFNVRMFTGLEHGSYHEYQDENYTDWHLGAEGRYAYSGSISVFGGITRMRGHEDRSSPDGRYGSEPTLFSRTSTFAGINSRFEQLTSRIGGTFESLDFRDVDTADGLSIDNDDRDRRQANFGGRFGYRFESTEPFFQIAADRRDYLEPVDIDGFDRDSDGFNSAVGALLSPSPDLDIELLAGWLKQDYEDPILEDVSTWDLGSEVTWHPPGSRTRVLARLDRTLEETTVRGASANLRTSSGINVSTPIRRNLLLNTRLNYSDNDYQGVSRNDNLLNIGLGLQHFLDPHVFIGVDYDFLRRDSNVPGEDFDNNRLTLSLGAQLEDGYERTGSISARTADKGLTGGFYLGLQAGHEGIGTAQAGPRGSDGTLLADFRDAGTSVGVFGGPALTMDNWNLALELESEQSEAGWSHKRTSGRIFSIAKEEEHGVALRIGRLVTGNNEIYARLGVTRGRFALAYSEAGDTSDRSEWLHGRRFGGGLEVPLASKSGLRLDYSHTDYDDLDIGSDSDTDVFAPDSGQVRLGIAWYPLRKDLPQISSPTVTHNGFYIGAHSGYGSLISDVEGPRRQSSELDARFGDSGALAGLHAGYGGTPQRFYLGGEVAADFSDVTWDHEREPSGRTYSIDRKSSISAALRAGYIVGSGALLYLRGGPVWTTFETRYEQGQETIRLEETDQGWQFGGGVELPIHERLTIRMDYSHSRYDSFEVDYGNGTDTFDNQENQVRLGISVQM